MTTQPPNHAAHPPVAPDAVRTQPYTALVYFHGMGNQRRYEEVGNLLQNLDNLLFTSRCDYEPTHLVQKAIKIEQFRPPTQEQAHPATSIAYYEVANPVPPEEREPGCEATVRFYEAYWAEYTAGGTTALSVLFWILRQTFRPCDILRAQWGEVGELRLGSLYGLYEQAQLTAWRQGRALSEADAQPYTSLIRAYRSFVDPADRYNKADGSYRGMSWKDFRAFLSDTLRADTSAAGTPASAQATAQLAQRWRTADTIIQWKALVKTLSIIVVFVWVVMLMLFGVSALLAGVLTMPWAHLVDLTRNLTVFDVSSGTFLHDLWAVSEAVIASFFVLWVGLKTRTVLSDYLGDVQQYVSYEETDVKYLRREAILQDTTAVLQHVLEDPACTRVIVVAHSLGTVIAYDTLLRLRSSFWEMQVQRNSAFSLTRRAQPEAHGNEQQLEKIQHFVTMGSPIDKVAYFFAAVQARSPHYLAMLHLLRGDISVPPFTRRGTHADTTTHVPQIHWVNYWDQGDVVSGPIWNIGGNDMHAERVDNVRVVGYAVPEPSRSHLGYFDNRDVLQDMFDMTFKNAYNIAHPPQERAPTPWVARAYARGRDPQSARLRVLQAALQWLFVLGPTLVALVAGGRTIFASIRVLVALARPLIVPALWRNLTALTLTHYGIEVIVLIVIGGLIWWPWRSRFSVDPTRHNV